MTEGPARRGRAARVAPRGATHPADRSAHSRAQHRIERWAGLVAVALLPVATVPSGAIDDEARRFVDLVLSDEGRAVLAAHGFLPPPAR